MPNWHDILNEIGKMGSPHDVVRRNYLKKLIENQNGIAFIQIAQMMPLPTPAVK